MGGMAGLTSPVGGVVAGVAGGCGVRCCKMGDVPSMAPLTLALSPEGRGDDGAASFFFAERNF